LVAEKKYLPPSQILWSQEGDTMGRYRTYLLFNWLWICLIILPAVSYADPWKVVSEKIARSTAASLKSGDILLLFCPTCGEKGSKGRRGRIQVHDIRSVQVVPVEKDEFYRSLGYRNTFLVRFWGDLILDQEIEPTDMPTNKHNILPINTFRCIHPRIKPRQSFPDYVAFNYHYVKRANGMFVLTGKQYGLQPSSGNSYNVPYELKLPKDADAILQKCRKSAGGASD